MSVHMYFAFSSGLESPLWVPIGTKARLLGHVEKIEQVLGLKREKYLDNPVHWDHYAFEFANGFPGVSDDVLCKTVEEHNQWVRRTYAQFAEWSKTPVTDGEELTPSDAAEFWYGFQELDVAPSRWTREYYRRRMEWAYDVMRGIESEGWTFEAKALTAKQAGAVVRLFEAFLDKHDMRLEVPKGQDYLASSYDGGYDWCEKCGAVTPEDGEACRKRRCPLRER